MKFDSLKNFFLFFIGLLLLLSLPALAWASPRQSCNEPTTGNLKVELNFATQPVKIGSNEVVVKLFDAAGKPINGAEVTVITAHPSEAGHHTTGDHAETDQAQPQADIPCDAGTEAGHEAAPMGEHDMAGIAVQAGTEIDPHHSSTASEHDRTDMAGVLTDSHEPAPTSEHDMAEMAEVEADHGGGHGEAGPTQLIARSTAGEYEGQVSFTGEGQWLVKVNLLAQGHSQAAEFTVDVVKRGPNWYVLGGFLSVNMGVIAAAAIMKQRTAKA